MAGERILVVEDDKNILELLQYNLSREGYRIIPARTGEEALRETRENSPDLVILDLMLPGIDGLEVCRTLKQGETTRYTPILMLTAKGEDSDIILGLELGAEDYMVKPFSPKVLVARIRTILRRSRALPDKNRESVLSIHGISLDTQKHEVTCAGNPAVLSATEFAILEFLVRNPGWVFSRNQIISAVKGKDYPVTERAVDVQILGLRRKLGNLGRHLETVRGIGYRMQEE